MFCFMIHPSRAIAKQCGSNDVAVTFYFKGHGHDSQQAITVYLGQSS